MRLLSLRSFLSLGYGFLLLFVLFAPLSFSQQLIKGSRVIEGSINYCEDSGTTDSYACNLSPAISAYQTGTCYTFRANTANTGAASLNLNSLGDVNIVRADGSTLQDNDITSGRILTVCYNGSVMQSGIVASGGGGGGVSGSGTIGRVARWVTNSTTLGDSIIRDDGSLVGIGVDPNSSYGLTIRPTTNLAPIAIQTNNGTNRFAIDSSGRILVNTNSTTHRMYINGGLRVLLTDSSAVSLDERILFNLQGGHSDVISYAANQNTATIGRYYNIAAGAERVWEFFHAGNSTAGAMFRFVTAQANTVPAEALRLTANQTVQVGGPFVITNSHTPASSSASGQAGRIAWDANYIYVATATDTWKRVAISSW